MSEDIKIIASKYRLLAEKIEKDWESSGNPGKLPRLYFDGNEDGDAVKIEKIRGFDLCIVHSATDPYLGCEEKVQRRGLCASHYASINYRVKIKELVTWEKLEDAHKVLPIKQRAFARSPISAQDYILDL